MSEIISQQTNPYREIALSVILQAKMDITHIARKMRKISIQLPRLRMTSPVKYEQARRTIEMLEDERSRILGWTQTPWFMELCMTAGVCPERAAEEICRPSPFRWPGVKDKERLA